MLKFEGCGRNGGGNKSLLWQSTGGGGGGGVSKYLASGGTLPLTPSMENLHREVWNLKKKIKENLDGLKRNLYKKD